MDTNPDQCARLEADLAVARGERDEVKRLLEGAHKANEILGAKAVAAGEERDRLLEALREVESRLWDFYRWDEVPQEFRSQIARVAERLREAPEKRSG